MLSVKKGSVTFAIAYLILFVQIVDNIITTTLKKLGSVQIIGKNMQ